MGTTLRIVSPLFSPLCTLFNTLRYTRDITPEESEEYPGGINPGYNTGGERGIPGRY